MPTKQVWSYTLAESNGVTKVTVQPAWDFPDDYCNVQTNPVPWSKPEEMLAFQAMLDKAPAAVAPPPTPTRAATAPTVAAAAAAPTPAPQVVTQDDAARRAQQHQACLDLAKNNPSVTCK
jgi:hypothetical protein